MRDQFHICILSFNHPELTSRTINSCLKWTTFEKISLIHNGSQSKHQDFLIKSYPQIQHVIIEKNVGYSGGCQKAMDHGSQLADWVLFLTNDCELLNLPTPPLKPGIYAPLLYRRKIGYIDSIGGYLDINKCTLFHCRSEEDFFEILQAKSSNKKVYIPGSAFWIHSSFTSHNLRMDESLGTYWEDVDFSIQCLNKNFSLGLHLETKVRHAVGKTCQKESYYTTYLYQRNKKIICLKYSKCLPITLFKLILQDLKLIFRFIKKRDIDRCRLLIKGYGELFYYWQNRSN